jgi:hypothetical protein
MRSERVRDSQKRIGESIEQRRPKTSGHGTRFKVDEPESNQLVPRKEAPQRRPKTRGGGGITVRVEVDGGGSTMEDSVIDPLNTQSAADMVHRPMFPNEPPNLAMPAPLLFKDYGMQVAREEVNLSNWSLLDQDLARLAKLNTEVKTLSLKNCDQIKDAGLSHLAACKKITVLNLSGCRLITGGC